MFRRKPAVAGSFYPSNPLRLGEMIDSYLGEAKAGAAAGEVVGLVSPHAGYVYSGPVAAYSYRLVDPAVRCAVVLAPSHRARFNGAALLPEGIYETPLGDVRIDDEIGGRLKDKKYFAPLKEAHELEHSLEVQVPFLQKVLDDFTIVPLIVGSVDLEVCRGIAEGIGQALAGEKRKTVIIMSTDLSHYHSYEQAKAMDGRFMDALGTFDPSKVSEVLSRGTAEACGEGPVLAGMFLCRSLGAKRVELLRYMNSGDTAGGKDQVVGYLAAAFVK